MYDIDDNVKNLYTHKDGLKSWYDISAADYIFLTILMEKL